MISTTRSEQLFQWKEVTSNEKRRFYSAALIPMTVFTLLESIGTQRHHMEQ